jgi:hypothetical protein
MVGGMQDGSNLTPESGIENAGFNYSDLASYNRDADLLKGVSDFSQLTIPSMDSSSSSLGSSGFQNTYSSAPRLPAVGSGLRFE